MSAAAPRLVRIRVPERAPYTNRRKPVGLGCETCAIEGAQCICTVCPHPSTDRSPRFPGVLGYAVSTPDLESVTVPIEGSEFTIDVDTVIIAIGNGANPLIKQTTAGLEFNKWGNIVVDESCKTSLEGVYAGGDIVLGAATVILAMGQGRTAAAAMNQYLAEK